jgi:hypothetical protein
LGKPNFNFQKRQKELAKQKKNEEKRQRKLDKNSLKPAEDQTPRAEDGQDTINVVWRGNQQGLSQKEVMGAWQLHGKAQKRK